MTTDAARTGGLDAAERAELESLRAEVARLRAGAGRPAGGAPAGGAPTDQPPAGRSWAWVRRWGRGVAAGLLVVLGCGLAPLSVVAVWARGEVTDTDRYVRTVAPLADDPAVQEAITTDLTNTVFRYVDIAGLTRQAFRALAELGSLPPAVAAGLDGLAGPVASGVRSFTADQVRKLVQSDLFARAWVEANRSAHEQLVAALTGQAGGGVAVEGDAVTVNLAAFLTVVKQRLVANGFELANRIPTVDATFVVFESADVGRVQRAFNLLDTVGYWLPFLLVALVAVGICLAPNRRLAILGAGLGLALAMLATAIGLAVLRRAYLDGVPADVLPPTAAANLYDTVVRFLRDAVRAGFLVGLVVAAAAVLTGPAGPAVALRHALVAAFAWGKGGVRRAAGLAAVDRTSRWVAPRARLLRILLVTAVFGVLLGQRYRTPALVGWLAVALLLGLAVIELLAVEPRRAWSAPDLPVGPAGPVGPVGPVGHPAEPVR